MVLATPNPTNVNDKEAFLNPSTEEKQDLLIKTQNFNQAIGFWLVTGYSRTTAIWHNPDIDSTTFPEDVWEGGWLYNWLAAATILEVVSSDVGDTLLGTGARTVLVSGLDLNYNPITEVVSMNGITPVSTVNSFLRVNGFSIASAWITGVNIWAITLRVVSDGLPVSIMAVWIGMARSAIYTVPAGFTLSIHSMVFSVNRAWINQTASVATVFRSQSGLYRMPLELSVYNSTPYLHEGIPWIIIQEKIDFALRCTYTSVNNMDLTAWFLWVLKSNSV